MTTYFNRNLFKTLHFVFSTISYYGLYPTNHQYERLYIYWLLSSSYTAKLKKFRKKCYDLYSKSYSLLVNNIQDYCQYCR